ncbi:MAG: RNA polymerase sigma factor [Bdellovibrionales bacterium]|nr:RNA polymerase sigma factor [Bdellovibrionales bacterium]
MDSCTELTSLMILAQNGDEESYRTLLEELYPIIYRRCRQALPSDALAEDCTQEALLAIHRMRHTYRPIKPLEAWVRYIVKNKIVDVYRKLASNPSLGASEDYDNEPATAEQFDRALEEREILHQMLSAISESLRIPFIMIRVFGYSVSETSTKLGISESLVKVRAHRASKLLREKFRAAEFSPL